MREVAPYQADVYATGSAYMQLAQAGIRGVGVRCGPAIEPLLPQGRLAVVLRAGNRPGDCDLRFNRAKAASRYVPAAALVCPAAAAPFITKREILAADCVIEASIGAGRFAAPDEAYANWSFVQALRKADAERFPGKNLLKTMQSLAICGGGFALMDAASRQDYLHARDAGFIFFAGGAFWTLYNLLGFMPDPSREAGPILEREIPLVFRQAP